MQHDSKGSWSCRPKMRRTKAVCAWRTATSAGRTAGILTCALPERHPPTSPPRSCPRRPLRATLRVASSVRRYILEVWPVRAIATCLRRDFDALRMHRATAGRISRISSCASRRTGVTSCAAFKPRQAAIFHVFFSSSCTRRSSTLLAFFAMAPLSSSNGCVR